MLSFRQDILKFILLTVLNQQLKNFCKLLITALQIRILSSMLTLSIAKARTQIYIHVKPTLFVNFSKFDGPEGSLNMSSVEKSLTSRFLKSMILAPLSHSVFISGVCHLAMIMSFDSDRLIHDNVF